MVPTDINIQLLTQWYYEYEKLLVNIREQELIEVGLINTYLDLEFVDLVMTRWVETQDKIIDQIISTNNDPFDLATAIAQRGFTLAEYKLLLSGKSTDESYGKFRVYDYFYIIDKDSENYFNSTQTKYEEQELLDRFYHIIEKTIKAEIPILNEFFFHSTVKKYLPLSSLKKHTYILGRSGSGKSQLIKYLFYNLQKNSQETRNKTLILIEPHGDLAMETLQFSLNGEEGRERLIYLDPFLRDTAKQLLGEDIFDCDYTFVINPFDIENTSNRAVNYMTQELSSAFFEILKSEATIQMEAIIQACVDTLLRTPGTSIADLKRFMDDDKNMDLVNEGLKNPNIERSGLMENFISDKKIKPTKSGIYYRLQSLIDDMELRRLLVGNSTVDLEKEMNSGKVIICNLSKGLLGKKSAPAFGKLLIALIQGFATKRQHILEPDRKDTFLFIDEMQNYVTDTLEGVLTETRKYALYVILANQLLGQRMDSKLKRAILSNTAIKVAGDNEQESIKEMAKQMGNINPKVFDKLPKYSFYMYDNNGKPRAVKAPSELVHIKPPFYMNKEALKDFFIWLANDSGYYIKVKSERNISEKHNKPEVTTSKATQDQIYIPNFDD